MDAESLIQHIERAMEATSFPLSVTADWLEDGNETTGNQFQQPDWQVGEIQKPEIKVVEVRASPVLLGEIDPAEPGSI